MAAVVRPRFSRRILLAVLLVGLLVLSGLASVPSGRSTATLPAAPSHLAPAASATAAPASPRPAATINYSAYQNDSSISNIPYSHSDCYPYAGLTGCYVQAQDPTLVQLPNSQVGVGYSVLTTFNTTNFDTCPTANTTVTRVAFAVSPDNGSTFGTPVFLPTVAKPCDYVQQLEPTFAVSGTQVWGAYVTTNATAAQLIQPAFSSNPPVLQWWNRTTAGIAITNSSDNGSTWSNATLLLNGSNFANPVLTSFGATLYLLYQNISNGTTILPLSGLSGADPISEQLVYSADGGATWHGPYTIPGENASQNYTTIGGSIAVSQGGTVAVAYATNRSCLNYCYASYYAASGDDIVDVTSTTNGTSWSPIHTIAPGQGEITRPYGPAPPYSCSQFSPSGTGLCGLFEDSPMTSVTWGTGAHLYVAWEAAPFRNVSSTPAYYYNYNHVAVYAGASNDSGQTWSWSEVSPALSNLTDAQDLIDEQWFNPAIGYSGGVVYLTFSYVNWGELTGFQAYGNGFATNTYSQWVATSANGVSYSSPTLIYISTRSDGLAYYHDMGVHASVGFTASGSPLFAYALADGWFTNIFPGTYDFVVTLSVSSAWSGATTTLTVDETGLKNGTAWQFALDGGSVTTTLSSVTISGIPIGQQMVVTWPGTPVSIGYRDLLEPVISTTTFPTFFGPSTVWFNFTSFYGITFTPGPNDYYLEVELYNYAGMEFGYNFYWETNLYAGTVTYYSGGNPFPWYLPSNTTFELSTVPSGTFEAYYYTQQFVDYWNGTGAGSYTGSGNAANLTVRSAFNETLWDLAVGTYSEEFVPLGLPASSTYSFDVDGAGYSSAGTTPTVVPGLTTGGHSVTNISATATAPGWSYFGHSTAGNPVLVPLVVQDNLSFSYVNTSAAAGTVSFHAIGVSTGAPWQLSFNGTSYSSSTPWLNLTTRPGDYAVAANPVVSANGSAALAPEPFGPILSVTPGGKYDVNYTAAYQLSVLRSTGGTVTPSGASVWLAANATSNLTATPSSGYSWGGWTGIGAGSYTGPNLTAEVTSLGPIQEFASFVPQPPNRFNLTVNETGLPVGSSWTVYLDGTGYSSTSASFVVPHLFSCVVSGSQGRYAVTVPPVGGSNGTEYLPAPGTPTTACVTSALVVAFDSAYAVTVSQTAGGVVLGAGSGVTWVNDGSSVTFQEETNAGYLFTGWVGTGPGSVSGTLGTIVVSPTGPVEELAEFALPVVVPVPTFAVTFTASSSLPSGAAWNVVFNGTTYGGIAPTIVVPNVRNGTYAYSVPAVGGLATGALYQTTGTATPVKVAGGPVSVPVTFAASYWVQVSGVGSGTVSGQGWVPSGHSVTLNATPTGSASFVGWVGTGNDSYTGSNAGPTLRVFAPVEEVASFASTPSGTTTPTSGSGAPSTALEAGLAVVGLVVGLAVGVVVARRGRPPASEGRSE
ncbi:MAG: exo-alpha-sialidase [Thermoplasmata archaeon]|nr:exo-alpha-sialidase [Thermoplasmata archaeon]